MPFFSFLTRGVLAPLRRERAYLRNKLHWHGIVRFDRSVSIAPGADFEGNNSLLAGTSFSGSMGYGSYIGEQCHIEGARIGRFCSLGNRIWISRGTHPLKLPFVSTSPVFYSPRLQTMETFSPQERFHETLAPVSIGNDCWVGVNVFIAGGITIGDGAVVLSGAAVVSDVPPYAIVGGVPAKVIDYRYDAPTIAWLLEKKWWYRPVDWLREHAAVFCNMEELKKLLDEN